MAGDSLVSLVFALNAKPNITIFLLDNVPKSFLTINFEILCCCQSFILTTLSQNEATSGNPKNSDR